LVGPGLRLFFSVRLSLARLEARSDTSTGIPITEGISSGPPRHRKIGSHPYQRPKQIDRPNREDQTRPQLRRGCVASAARVRALSLRARLPAGARPHRFGRITFTTACATAFIINGASSSEAVLLALRRHQWHAPICPAPILKRALTTSCHRPHLNGHACTQHTDNHNMSPQEERPRGTIVTSGERGETADEGPPSFLHHLDVLRELAAVRGLE
jgi:hypothetical protein